jgi:hypothetical protein
MNVLQKSLGTNEGINYTNIILMALSLVFSVLLPFETFLFVYAVLGPLHYLTEISWLEKRSFFVTNKKDVILFLVCGILFTIPVFFSGTPIQFYLSRVMMLAVFYAAIIVLVKNNILKYGLAVIFFFISMAKKDDYSSSTFLFYGILIPTIIHVFIFTGLFILFGALKTKSKSGLLSLLFFIICPIILFLVNIDYSIVQAGNYIKNNLANFEIINKSLIMLFGLDNSVTNLQSALQINKTILYSSSGAIMVARFIAFAYTYHYLNWFSKTSVIKWHDVSKKRMFVILFLWIGSVVFYIINYQLGFKILFLLSIMHVLLEFPLNIVTLKGIGIELKNLVRQ